MILELLLLLLCAAGTAILDGVSPIQSTVL